jgi:hypothetical protein
MMRDNPEIHSPEHWRGMAREARNVANGLATDTNRKQMLAVAENYERLAEEAEEEAEGRNYRRSGRQR